MRKGISSVDEPHEIRPQRGRVGVNKAFAPDGALQASKSETATFARTGIAGPLLTFEGLGLQDNINVLGFGVLPPDPVGDVGPNHYVQMVNVVFAVYDKQGNLLAGPTAVGDLWSGFAVEDCSDASGDVIVLYDQFKDRWILSQFTTRGPTYYDCVAVSQTGDPTGAYYRYAFAAGEAFPDYPKYGVWTDSYILTTADFGPGDTLDGASVYALEKDKMIAGSPRARAVQFSIDAHDPAGLALMGGGLLPPDIDGDRPPFPGMPAPVVSTQDGEGEYGATFDAVNVFELQVLWRSRPFASFKLRAQLPVAPFDSVFPCAAYMDCLAQPGISNTDQYLDFIGDRPLFRLAYRNFGAYEALVTNQSVEATPGVAGVRWYEIRRTNGVYSVFQDGTYAPGDGVNRWMGSAAMDWQGNIAIGYSVVNGTDVYPGIRYTGRLAGDPRGQMTLGEGTIIDGTGVQRSSYSRWGDYSSLNVDPTDDCTFWYVNEYYTLAGQVFSSAGWQTRIGSFKLPGCDAKPGKPGKPPFVSHGRGRYR